ncbi:hypothetical protein K2173_027178 [Erythroxylum novogranatense]|uniref:PDZ domain-containing protein n=1 Tax=Erythroxylum novogranatense TaxID=1862640 RepID=A0AAV8TYC1_9ROSI|nr:hypothetical protein K2173_027178 [Erythroxylum novogranatense]
MNQFLKRVSAACARSSVLRIVSIAATGSTVLCLCSDSDFSGSISFSIPAQLRQPPSLPWKMSSDLVPPFNLLDGCPFGTLSLFSCRVSPISSHDFGKLSSGVDGDGSKPNCGCLGRDSLANAAASVSPAVVNISVPLGFYSIAAVKSVGSGTIVDSDGTILTCAHVVANFQGTRPLSKGKVDVTLQDGRTFEGTLVNADLHSDIAIVKIKSKTPLPTAKLGSSSKLRPGDWVIAMGCPLSLQNTVTAGIVSCVDRKSRDLGLGGVGREFLQIDCAINEGNSGGPLVNVDGEIVGINIMKVLAADGLGFAVPIDSVAKIIEQFKKSGRVVRPWLGLRMIELNEKIIAQLRERDAAFPNVDRGVLVPMITPGSPADRAGFISGDVVIKFDGKPVKSIDEVSVRVCMRLMCVFIYLKDGVDGVSSSQAFRLASEIINSPIPFLI